MGQQISENISATYNCSANQACVAVFIHLVDIDSMPYHQLQHV